MLVRQRHNHLAPRLVISRSSGRQTLHNQPPHHRRLSRTGTSCSAVADGREQHHRCCGLRWLAGGNLALLGRLRLGGLDGQSTFDKHQCILAAQDTPERLGQS